MRGIGKTFVGLAVLAVFLTLPSRCRALDWPWKTRVVICPRCGQPHPRVIVVRHAYSCPATVTVAPAAPAAPLPAQPRTTVSGGAPAPAGESAPSGVSPLPGTTESAAPGSTAPSQAEAQPGAAPAAPETTPPAQSAGLGGGLSEPQGALNMFGDMAPVPGISALQAPGGFRPPPPPEPPSQRPVRFPTERMKSAALVPTIRSFKFADNQTPMPVDRVTYSFNFFDNVNEAVNQRQGVPLHRIQAYRSVFGFEKTFLDQRASFGMRLPLNTLTADSPIPNLGRTSTAVGDLTAYVKYALWIDRPRGRVVSTGLALTMPTGPGTFGGANYLRGLHYTGIQPYLGEQWTWRDWYVINFSALDISTSSRDVTIFYKDIAVGYFLYRNANPSGLLRSVAPTFETHINTPLNHFHPFDRRDLAATCEVVDLTEGLNVFFRDNSVLSLGLVQPITGPRPFSLEALLLYNKFF